MELHTYEQHIQLKFCLHVYFSTKLLIIFVKLNKRARSFSIDRIPSSLNLYSHIVLCK